MAELKLHYRHNHHFGPHYNNNADIEKVAADVRGQLGVSDRRALCVKGLAGIDRLNVNGVCYDLWVDLEHSIHDDEHNEVFGLFEYAPQSSIDAVSVCVAPIESGLSAELQLSTLAHETGHAIFDGPALVAYHQNQPLSIVRHADSVRAYRSVTESKAHLQKINNYLPAHIRFAEFRANEFVGSLLVPRHLLWDVIMEEAPKHALEIQYEDTLFGATMDGNKRIVRSDVNFEMDCWTFTRVLAPHFGVSPAFIEVRMMRYGIISSEMKPH